MSVEKQFETEVLELAVRKVRTPEGSQKFGLPIGAIITADAEAYAKANGFTDLAPEEKSGFKKSSTKGQHMKGTISGKAAAEKNAPKAEAPKKLNLKIQKSSLTGNKHFSVGSAKYVAPNGSKLIRPKAQPGMAYVVTPDGKAHAFNEAGEIVIPKPLDVALAKKFGEGFEPDADYDLEEFEATSASHALPDLKVGSTLTDADGTPQFKKLADDSWEHVDLGVKLKDQDLQDLYDNGDLIPDATDADNTSAEETFQDTEAMNFSEMSKAEAESAIQGLPEGQKLTVGESKWTKDGPDSFTSDDGKKANAKSLSVVKSKIKLGADPEPEYNPLDGDTVNPLDANPPKLVGDQPDADWIKNSLPGAQLDFEAPNGTKTTWTKDEDGAGWTNQRGGKLSQEALQQAHKNTDGKGLSIKKEGKSPKPAAGDAGTQKTPEKKAAPAAEEPKPVKLGDEGFFEKATPDQPVYHDGKKFTYDGIYWEDTDGEYAYLPSEMENQYEKGTVTDSPYDQVETIQLPTKKEEAPKSVALGDAGYFDNAEEGDVVYVKGKRVINTDIGWETEDGFTSYGSGELAKLYEDGKVSEEASAYFPSVDDLGPHTSQEETLSILTAAAPGEQIHAINSNFTLTKVNDDSDMVLDEFGDTAEDVGGFWQSNVTGKLVSSQEMAQIWDGDLQKGPGKNRSGASEKKPSIVEAIKGIESVKTIQEMQTALSAANPGEKVHNSSGTYEKNYKGTFTHEGSGVELNPSEMASFNWDMENEKSNLKYGVAPEAPAADSNPIDAIPDDSEFDDAADAAAEAPEPDEYIPVGHEVDPTTGLPKGVPAGSKALDPNDDLPEDGVFYEASPNGQLYTHVAKDGEWKTTLPSGFVVPGNSKQDVQEIMNDGSYEGTFYEAPKPLPAGLPSDAKEWDSNVNNFDTDTQSLYAVETHSKNPAVYEFVPTEYDEYLTYGPGEDGSLTSHYDVQDMMDQGSHTFYVGSPTKFAKKDPDQELGWKVGDELTTVEDFDEVPVSTKLAYLKNDGTSSYYGTLGNGMLLTPGGKQMPAAKMKWAVSNGKLSIHELPDTGTPAAPEEQPQYLFMNGDKISHLEALASFPVGQKLEMKNADGSHSNFVIKQADGSWQAPDDDPNWPGLQFTNGDMSDSIKKGFLYFPGDAIMTDAPEVEEPKNLLSQATILKGEVQAALDGLEAHSSFHVKYGLKDLPASNPLTKEANQEELKQLAQEKYPDLKVKPAVVQYLKDYLGISDDTSTATTDDSDAPKITIGSKTPKKVGVQGMDGGEFTQKDIQSAIEILENYPGKLFKNELSKKGNPLGELDPTQIVGFDKDKLVTKQKYIDLLKTKLIVQEEQTKHPAVKSLEELSSYPVGTSVKFTSSNGSLTTTQIWTKINDDQWHLEDPSDFDKSNGLHVAPTKAFETSITNGKLSLHKLPDAIPEYAKTPSAVQDKEKEQLSTDDPDFNLQTIVNAEIGTKMHWGEKGVGNRAEKTGDDEWTIWDADGNYVNMWGDGQFYNGIAMGKNKDGSPNAWQFDDVSEETPTFNKNESFAIIPGKYSTENGKAFMVVNSDGSGTHYSPTGMQVKLTPEKVKANYDKGMSKYHGLINESELPAPGKSSGPNSAMGAKPAAVKKPKVVADVPDGTYFGGNPSDPKTSVYEIDGDNVKVYKAATGLTASTGVKIGGGPTTQWMDEAGFGAKFTENYSYVDGVAVGPTTFTKGKDGKWTQTKTNTGEVVKEGIEKPAISYYGHKVASHGMSEPVTLTKAKVNTLFQKGELTDQYGNSVVPEGYTGSVMFLGSKTTVPAMVGAQKWLQDLDGEGMNGKQLGDQLMAKGVHFDSANWKKYLADNGLSNKSFEESKDALIHALDNSLSGVDTDIPETDTASLFQWNDLGQPVMPLELAVKDVPYGKTERGEWIKAASKSIGDGKVIGLHLAKMDIYDRGYWITHFKNGDFASMYNLEVAAAALEGKAHGSGYLHPGFPDNEGTKKIAWASAVEGEISALDDVPGDWSSTNLTPSLAEVNNYLIKAQMQNPTYLTPQERRQWVKSHLANNKTEVDKLSATAALRKKNGEAELSEAPAWTNDVQPAKSYDHLFEGNATPTTGWNTTSAADYVSDNSSNEELKGFVAKKEAEGYTGGAAAYYAVQAYFQGEIEKDAAAKAKVFYVKSPNQKVKKGTHPIYEYDDFNGHGPLGNHYFFKPSPQGDAYRSEAEHLGHEYGWVFGFKTAGSELTTLDGKYGQLQKDLGSKSSLAQFDLSTLSANQIADIGKEHLLDWFLDNDDTHSENMQVMPDGSLVGIDKGRAFKHFGKWQGLNPSAMNSNAQTIYSKLFQTIQSGKLSKEDVDKAYLQIKKRAVQMSKVNDEKISEMLAKGMAKRSVWDVSYKIDGKAVPNNLKGLTAAVLDRKNKLPEQIEGMWKDIYKKAGFGDLPEPPAYKLGEEHYSGLSEAHFHENAFKVGGGGVSTLMAGDFSQTGAAIAWNTTNKDGSKEVFTQVELNHVADAKVYSKLQSMNPDATDGSADPTTFDKDEYGGFFSRDYYRTMATLAKHNDDKAYNADRIAEYQIAKTRLQKDLTAIQQTTLPTPNKEGLVKFPSGAMVPQQQLGQYRMMLEFYQSKEAAMDATIATQADFPASAKAKFEPYPLAVKGKHYANSGMDAQLSQLANGDYVYSDPSVSKVVTKEAVPDMISAVGGWKELASEPEGPKNFGGATVQLVNSTFETKGTWDNDTGQIASGTASVGSWSKGSEYKITLPTGETIYFRNRAKTNTLHSQYGRMTIKVPNTTDPNAYAAGIERAQDWIASYLDLDMGGAEDEDAELIYWKQMLPTLTRRTHKSGTKYAKAFSAVETKAKELGISTDDFPFRLNDFMTRDEQIAFYRKIWADQFGQDKIDKLISEQGYLPSYEGTDIHSKDVVHGRPIWKRFDITLADVLKSNPKAFVASHNTSGGGESKKAVAISGAHLSTEERIRFFGGTAGGSSSADQQQGTGGQDQFTRIWNNPSASGFDYVYHPSTLLHTNTRFFHNDAFGAESSEKSSANPDPLDWFKNKVSNSGSLGGGNQLDIRWASSWLNSLEMVVFDNAADRDYAIQKLKQAGLETIRGLPVEDRLVMRQNTANAIAKLRKQWEKEAGL